MHPLASEQIFYLKIILDAEKQRFALFDYGKTCGLTNVSMFTLIVLPCVTNAGIMLSNDACFRFVAEQFSFIYEDLIDA